MLRIKNNNITINRGNEAIIKLKIPVVGGFYEFSAGSTITFSVKTNFKEKEAVLRKIVTVAVTTDTVSIPLTSEDTLFGDLIDKPATYFYDIILNDETTIVGYDGSGYKTFVLLPEGSRDE